VGAGEYRNGRKKGRPVIKFKVQTCWPTSPHVWRTVVEWEYSRESQRSVETLQSMRYRVRIHAQFIDGASYLPDRRSEAPVILGEFHVAEFDSKGELVFLLDNPLCRFLPEWVHRGVDKEDLVSHA